MDDVCCEKKRVLVTNNSSYLPVSVYISSVKALSPQIGSPEVKTSEKTQLLLI